MNAVPQLFFDAAALGGIYAMAALGIALIFGVMNLVNFAHGEYIAFCVFALIVPSSDAVAVMFLGKAPAILLIPVLLALGALIAVASEYVVFRQLRNADPVAMMISSFALGFVIQNALLAVYGSRPKAISLWPDLNTPISVVGASVPLLQLIVIITTLLVVSVLALLLKKTRVGLEMRAAAENFTMARLLGVRANVVITGAFALSGAMAAAVAMIMVTQTGVADVRMGGQIMLVAFIATVIGGLSDRGRFGRLAGRFAAGRTAVSRRFPLHAGDRQPAASSAGPVRIGLCQAEGLIMMDAHRQNRRRALTTPVILIAILLAFVLIITATGD